MSNVLKIDGFNTDRLHLVMVLHECFKCCCGKITFYAFSHRYLLSEIIKSVYNSASCIQLSTDNIALCSQTFSMEPVLPKWYIRWYVKVRKENWLIALLPWLRRSSVADHRTSLVSSAQTVCIVWVFRLPRLEANINVNYFAVLKGACILCSMFLRTSFKTDCLWLQISTNIMTRSPIKAMDYRPTWNIPLWLVLIGVASSDLLVLIDEMTLSSEPVLCGL